MTVIGIDFGTTTCSVAKWSGDKRQKPILLDVEPTSPIDRHIMRTAVNMPDGQLRNFKLAIDRSGRGDVVIKPKRPDHNAIQYTYDQMYQCLYALNNDTQYILEVNCENIPVLGGGDWSEQDLTAGLDKLFENIYARVWAEAAADIIVVGLPLGFMDLGRERVINSLIRAGWAKKKSQVILFPEPLATALQCGINYRTRTPNQQRILVADLGGGTLDMCVFTLTSNSRDFHIKVLGQRRCDVAGNRFDRSLLNWIVDRHPYMLKEYGVQDAARIRDYRLHDVIEQCKIRLSNHDKAQLDHTLPSGRALNVSLSRSDLNSALSNELDCIRREIGLLLNDCGSTGTDIHKVCLAGGSCKMPAIQNVFQTQFPQSEFNSDYTGFGMLAQGLALVPQYQDLIERLCESSYAVWDYKNRSMVQVVKAGDFITPHTNSVKVTRKSINIEENKAPAPLIVFHQQGGEWQPLYQLEIDPLGTGVISIVPDLDEMVGSTRLVLKSDEETIPTEARYYSDIEGLSPPVVRKGQIVKIGDDPTTYYVKTIRDIKTGYADLDMAVGFMRPYRFTLDQYKIHGEQTARLTNNSELSIMQISSNESTKPLIIDDLVRNRPFVRLMNIEGNEYSVISPRCRQ